MRTTPFRFPHLRLAVGRLGLDKLALAAGAAALMAGGLGGPSAAHAQAGQIQDLGVVLDGVLTESAFRDLKASGKLQEPDRGEGFVYVEVSPSSAQVAISKRKGEGPTFTLEHVPSGYQPITISASGYDAITGYVFVEPMRVSRVRIVLPPKDGDLTILSEPAGARVLIDGQSVGVAPLTIERLAGGEHEIMLTADGGLVWQGRVLIAGGVEVLRPRLKPADDQAALAATAPVMPPSPTAVTPVVPPRPVVAPTPVAPIAPVPSRAAAAPSAPVTPATPAATAGAGEIDLTGLSPQLRGMAWQKLVGKRVEVVLGTGQRAAVEVGEVRGDAVILKEAGGAARLVPLSHISKVRE